MLLTIFPSTIGGAIALGIVNSAKAEIWRWARPKVSEESLETVPPSLADCQATAAVSVGSVIPRIITATEHRFPSSVFL